MQLKLREIVVIAFIMLVALLGHSMYITSLYVDLTTTLVRVEDRMQTPEYSYYLSLQEFHEKGYLEGKDLEFYLRLKRIYEIKKNE